MIFLRNYILGFSLFLSLLAVPASVFADVSSKKTSHDFEVSKNLDIFNSIFKELDLFYVDSVMPEKTIKYGIDAMLGRTDPYTVYYQEEDMKDLKFMTTGSYAGVGAVISQNGPGKSIYISEIYEGMPAHKAGLKAGDVFVSLDGVSVENYTTQDVSSKLRGEPNTTVKVVVSRKGVSGVIKTEVVRQQVVIDPIPYYGMLNDKVGYISISSFTDQSYSSFHNAFNNLKQKNMTSLVIDLRGNPGGLLSEAVRILNMFVPRNTKLVYTRGKEPQWNSEYVATELPVDLDIPICVLVNRNSASASEIVSGALQDLDRAVIIGDRTYGKGLVQTTRDLPYGGSLKVTISKYYIPSGRCIQAIDYAKRDEDGFVARIPDSLTHVFHTAAGREVRDGCGVSPDVFIKLDKMPPIVSQLLSKNIIFDYVTEYQAKHPSIPPVASFSFNEFDEFVKFALDSGFKYEAESAVMIKKLKKVATDEGYYDKVKDHFDAYDQLILIHQESVFNKFKQDIVRCISDEIIRRYYFQRGSAQYGLTDDKYIDMALSLLDSTDEFKKYLNAKVVGEFSELKESDLKETEE